MTLEDGLADNRAVHKERVRGRAMIRDEVLKAFDGRTVGHGWHGRSVNSWTCSAALAREWRSLDRIADPRAGTSTAT